jgi:hypothetical protein
LKKWNANSFKVKVLDEATLGKINDALLYQNDFEKQVTIYLNPSKAGSRFTYQV